MKNPTLLKALVGTFTEGGLFGLARDLKLSPSSISRLSTKTFANPKTLRRIAEHYSAALNTPVNESLLVQEIDAVTFAKIFVAAADVCNREQLMKSKT